MNIMDQKYRVTFIGDEGFDRELTDFAASNPGIVTIESRRSDQDASRLGFDLATASAIVTIITSTFYFGELGFRLYRWLGKSKTNKIIIQTPLRTIEIVKSDELTEDDVKRLLEEAYRAPE